MTQKSASTESPACVLCQPCTHEILWQDAHCRVVWLNDADYPGYCRVEWLDHVKEMTDLILTERQYVMHVVFAVEQALRDLLSPTKINLASLGNKTPHLHWHVIPRFNNDKHFPNSHWGAVTRAVIDMHDGVCEKPLSQLQLTALKHALYAQLAANSGN